MGILFGTDGVRGLANQHISPELAFRLGQAGAQVLIQETGLDSLVLGRDTRLSGDMLEGALIAGICSAGVNVLRVGILPTPAVAYLCHRFETGGGVVISASHNAYQDNGIKFFGASGYKLSEALENKIEKLALEENPAITKPTGAAIGSVQEFPQAGERYIRYVCNTGPSDLEGFKMVLDCANGAAFEVAPQVFGRLGATVIPIANNPDGININASCGSTNPELLQKTVLAEQADIGLAFDGDADRVVAVDERGQVLDGDQIMVICAKHRHGNNNLAQDALVVTVMSNLGLHLALSQEGIKVRQCQVGDRYVLEEMLRVGCCLGGEQSGHIIFLDYNTTGDGIITGLQLLKVMRETSSKLSSLSAQMERLPQLLKNVTVKNREVVMNHTLLAENIRNCEQALQGQGRVLVRPSGTEPIVRVMAEAKDQQKLEEVVHSLARVIEEIDQKPVPVG